MKWIRENVGLLLSVLLVTMTLAVFGPIELYFTNSSEFWFSLKDVFLISAILTTTFMVLLTGIGFLLRGKARKIYSALLFVLGVLFYVQGNYANIDYGALDGTAIDWSGYQLYGILDTLGWLALIVVTFMLFLKNHKLFLTIQKYGSLFIVATQTLTLVILMVTSQGGTQEKSNYFLTTDGMYDIGSNENIIIFILDAFDDEYFEDIVTAYPDETKESFKNFVRFNNASVGGAQTKIGLPAILTGEPFLGGESYSEYVMRAFDSDGLYTDLKQNDYDIRVYTHSSFVPPESEALVKNQASSGYAASSYFGLSGKYFILTCYKYMPHILKPCFWFYSEEFEQYKTGNSGESYIIDDLKFYENLKEDGLHSGNSENAVRIYHLNGAHSPYSLNEYAEAVNSEDTSAQQQARGALFIVNEYMSQMKKLGLYDNSTIILMADHGSEDPAHGILLVKSKNANSDYCETDVPVSYFDLHETLFECIGKEEGNSFFDISADQERDRYFYLNNTESGKMQVNEYRIYGHMNEGNSREETGNIYSEEINIDETYTYGTVLTFGAEATTKQYIVSGISSTDMEDYSWTDGDVCIFRIPLNKVPDNNLLISLNVMTTYSENGPQRVHAYANDTLCMMDTLNGGSTVEFVVPKDCIDSENPVLELKLNLLDAVCPQELFGEGHDARTLALALRGLWITETELEPEIGIVQLPLEEEIMFEAGNDLAEKIFEVGLSGLEESHVWTDGAEASMLANVDTADHLSCEITLVSVFNHTQRIQIESNGTEVYSDEVTEADEKFSFVIPKESIQDGLLMLKFHFPDAISPKELGTGADGRELALALNSIRFSELKESEENS